MALEQCCQLNNFVHISFHNVIDTDSFCSGGSRISRGGGATPEVGVLTYYFKTAWIRQWIEIKFCFKYFCLPYTCASLFIVPIMPL